MKTSPCGLAYVSEASRGFAVSLLRGNHEWKMKTSPCGLAYVSEASRGFEPLSEGFADPCLTTWPRRQLKTRAGDGIRTHDLLLGKETFYH